MDLDSGSHRVPTATHWGTYYAEVDEGRLVAVHDYEHDPAPAIIGPGIVEAVDSETRIRRPMVRKGFLDRKHRSNRSRRGAEPFVAVSWETALDLAAAEIDRVRTTFGNGSIFAGSYGWGSAGRFHHAQSQVHRFMNAAGGYVRHQNTYSNAAAEVMLKHVVADMRDIVMDRATQWPDIASDCDLLIAFGGLPLKNAQVSSGGVGRHVLHQGLQQCFDNGVQFLSISPLRSDFASAFDPEWLPIRPNTDVALMLALAHTLITEALHDQAFVDRYTVGFEPFAAYVTGEADGQVRDADWAAGITGIDASTIRQLARRMSPQRTMIMTNWALQRGDHGEQPIWLTVVLAALIGQVGLPGGGFGIGYGSANGIGNPVKLFRWPALPQGNNPVDDFIPVARIADLLLNPGGHYDYDGESRRFADIRLVYWAGGNPFHHHQDLNRLVDAFRRPECIIVNEIWWTATARHADIVFPATTALERNDIMMCHWESVVTPMKQAIEPVGDSRNDYDIFSALARRLGCEEAYTEGRDERDWLRHLWDMARQRAGGAGFTLPDFDTFWNGGPQEYLQPEGPTVLLDGFRADPDANPLTTPSGRIEICSDTVAGFGYDDCPGHPVWREPYEWLGSPKATEYPLHLVSGQPPGRLHSQLDGGSISQGSKINDREPLTMNPHDAAARELATGDTVIVFNDRGACLAGLIVSDMIMPGVVQLCTGAWYDPDRPGALGAMCKHGNPNVLTRDKGTSRLAQAPSAHSTLIEVRKFAGVAPAVTAHRPPPILEEGESL